SAATATTISYLLLCFSAPLRPLHSFPTRRSSDLSRMSCCTLRKYIGHRRTVDEARIRRNSRTPSAGSPVAAGAAGSRRPQRGCRSEEHTSELQSPYDLVCRLLLEKKKKYKHKVAV